MEMIKMDCVQDRIVVSSRDVAERLGKEHSKVIRSIENILTEPNLASLIIPSEYKDKKGEMRKEYLLTKDGFTLYMFNIQGYNDFKLAYIQEFNRMEKALADIKFRVGDKKHQLDCMALLQDILPLELKKEKVSYIKANTVVNKVVSDVYNFPKMIKKTDMNPEMLALRENVLDDYLKLYDVLQSNSMVRDALNRKYSERNRLK